MISKAFVDDIFITSYVIASADMRYIERSDREVYLCPSEDGPIIRGQMPDCGPTCYAPLGQVLLEYVMSCEGCVDYMVQADAADRFGGRLGQSVAGHIQRQVSTSYDVLLVAMNCVMQSLEVDYVADISDSSLTFTLVHNPLEGAARRIGAGRGVTLAQRALLTLCRTMIDSLSPGWNLEQPADLESEQPVLKFIISSQK